MLLHRLRIFILLFLHHLMTSQPPQPLPKFGEWDVKNPSSADGFTVIFAKARDENKTGGGATVAAKAPPPKPPPPKMEPSKHRFCCF
ncbi:putative RPM1-interacting protein 4/NOI4 [Helianthus annuus]|uniref:Putative RIN4, pathogenic type III effector avirulence factor Avr cleavage site n=1 Tax=Helianthus annuus TaxID=4232 RepID=A0A251SJX6_HELAN|nr:putative RPM1-interacting protein 4/NOI4 [Helianthus annuus]KAJ0841210.1 putative RPM1-interacting protein 4/NOI4 [Helianthus annuus]